MQDQDGQKSRFMVFTISHQYKSDYIHDTGYTPRNAGRTVLKIVSQMLVY